MRKFCFLFLIAFWNSGFAQNSTDFSLFRKSNKSVCLTKVESKSGNLFHKLGHHGPAIENEWFGLRIYFDKREAIDVYSKSKPGLELREAQWYPTREQQKKGWGADYYRVGKTVGLGGIKLWDGQKVIPLNPVSKRTATVVKQNGISTMEMLSEGIPYKGEKVDILVRVSVFPDSRKAKVEAFSKTNYEVQFVTGINYHKGLVVRKSKDYVVTWGIYPEDVAAEKIAVGAALIINENDFEKQMDDGKQFLFISKPTNHLETWITSANAREPELNTLDKFITFLNKDQ